MRLVVGIAGGLKAGKTTLARELSEEFGWPVASFGDRVRAEARARRLEERREVLQELGERLIAELGWPRFVGGVLEPVAAADNFIVEGIRHVAAADTLRVAVAPRRFICIGVEVDPATRSDRASPTPQRSPDDALAQHSTESSVRLVLRSRADFVVDAGDADKTERVITFVRSLMTAGE